MQAKNGTFSRFDWPTTYGKSERQWMCRLRTDLYPNRGRCCCCTSTLSVLAYFIVDGFACMHYESIMIEYGRDVSGNSTFTRLLNHITSLVRHYSRAIVAGATAIYVWPTQTLSRALNVCECTQCWKLVQKWLFEVEAMKERERGGQDSKRCKKEKEKKNQQSQNLLKHNSQSKKREHF